MECFALQSIYLFDFCQEMCAAESFPVTLTDKLERKVLITSVAFATTSLVGISTYVANSNAADADTSADVANVSGQDEKAALGPAPTDFGLKYDYYTDCSLVSLVLKIFSSSSLNVDYWTLTQLPHGDILSR